MKFVKIIRGLKDKLSAVRGGSAKPLPLNETIRRRYEIGRAVERAAPVYKTEFRLSAGGRFSLGLNIQKKNMTFYLNLTSGKPGNITLRSLLKERNAPDGLIGTLRQAFNSNNLSLRNSLINLVSDIHAAGKTKKGVAPLVVLSHPADGETGRFDFISFKAAEKLIEDKLKGLKPYTGGAAPENGEVLIKTIAERIRKEQNDEWRYEKLQRGLM
ncbi:MAG: hypothetical protein LBI38_02835 [Oscillospiraceae bacterium]|jgi:hypothetical protein|nr:hypothetical protein [Oscillospiraceae bacterium]